MEAVQIQLREVGIELELEETDWVAKVRPTLRDQSPWLSLRHPPSKKAVEPQIAAFNAGKAWCISSRPSEIYQMWQASCSLLTSGTGRAVRKIGSYKFEHFEIMPLFDAGIEVVVDTRSSTAGPSPGGMAATWYVADHRV